MPRRWQRTGTGKVPATVIPAVAPAPAAPPSPIGSSGHVQHLPGLDGLRAIAVLAVLGYHAGIAWMAGGYLGVEVFFVISGYLITALLLAEHDRSGRIELRAFWLRRARRLLPALFLLLGATLFLAVLFLPDQVARLRTDSLAAAGYMTNWYLILRNQSYFESVGRPSALGHLWSLAVEEQFYLFWPIVLSLGLALLRRRRMLVATLGAAVGSALLMAVLFQPGGDPSAVYYGTDTRLTGLLVGAALAFVWVPTEGRPVPGDRGAPARVLWDAVALGGLVAIAAFVVLLDEHNPLLYRGGFAALDLGTVLVIAAVVHPRATIGRLILDRRPLRWLGERSYGIYLWHWPIFTITRPQLDVPLDPLPDLLVRLGLTLAIAEASYRWLETPIRRGALGRAWQAWRAASGRRAVYRRQLAGGIALGVIAAAVGAQVMVAAPPATPSYLAMGAVHDQDDVSSAQPPGPAAQPSATTTGAAPAAGLPAAESSSPRTEPPLTAAGGSTPQGAGAGATQAGGAPGGTMTTHPPPAGSPGGTIEPASPRSSSLPGTTSDPATGQAPGAGGGGAMASPPSTQAMRPPGVLAVGDSVMLGAVAQLRRAIPGIRIDAEVGRSFDDGVKVLRRLRSAGRLPPTVVIGLGSNGWLTAGQLDEAMGVLAGVDLVAFVNLKEPRDWEDHDNQVLAATARRYSNVLVIDWHDVSVSRPGLFWDDGIHLRAQGASVYARLVAASLD